MKIQYCNNVSIYNIINVRHVIFVQMQKYKRVRKQCTIMCKHAKFPVPETYYFFFFLVIIYIKYDIYIHKSNQSIINGA